MTAYWQRPIRGASASHGHDHFPFRHVSEFRDIEAVNAYRELTEQMGEDPARVFPAIAAKNRDNARTPMQWDDTENAGFTTGTPWIAVNPNYTKINAKEQTARADSVFHYYQALIRLRHENPVIVYGHYQLLLPEDPDLFVYTRELDGQYLLIVCNFSDRERELDLSELADGKYLPEGFFGNAQCLIRNYPDTAPGNRLLPYETFVLSGRAM